MIGLKSVILGVFLTFKQNFLDLERGQGSPLQFFQEKNINATYFLS
jgi:hypothetical protein